MVLVSARGAPIIAWGAPISERGPRSKRRTALAPYLRVRQRLRLARTPNLATIFAVALLTPASNLAAAAPRLLLDIPTPPEVPAWLGSCAVWCLLLALGLVLYTYAGYPLLCLLLARLRPRPLAKDALWPPAQLPTLTVVIAAYREAGTITDKLATLAAQDYPAERVSVVLCCDGSDDGTPEVAEAAGRRLMPGRLQVLRLLRGGKPAALNAGVAVASGEILVMTDARQRMNPGALQALAHALSDPQVGIVSGELVLGGDAGAGAYWRYEAWIRRNEGRSGSVIGVSGALYAMPRRLWRPLPPETILDDLLTPLWVRQRGLRVAFEPGAQAFDQAAAHGREFLRKARTLSGNYQLLLLAPELLLPWRNPSWLGFVSHKLLRLLVPFALVGLLLATLLALGAGAEPAGPLWAFLLAQLGGYGLALLHLWPPARRSALVRLASTFVVLNAAAVVGLWRVLRTGRNQRWT